MDETLLRRLRGARRLALTTHRDADADGLGCELALWHAGRQQGLDVVIVNEEPLPARYAFLGTAFFRTWAEAGEAALRADFGLLVDAHTPARCGLPGEALARAGVPLGALDHHLPEAGALPGEIDPSVSSTAELCVGLLDALRWPFGVEAAQALFAGIAFDTGSFRYLRNRAETLRIGARLIETGIDADEISRALFASNPYRDVRLLAALLAAIEIHAAGRLALVALPEAALGPRPWDTEVFDQAVRTAIGIDGVVAAAAIRPAAEPGRWRVSFRSVAPVDVAAVARALGGGGHQRAAGTTLAGSLAAVREAVLARLTAASAALREGPAQPRP